MRIMKDWLGGLMVEKRFSVKKSESGLFYRDGYYEIDNTIQFIIEIVEMKLNHLSDENEQLKQRNDRQAKQLDRLYSLVEEKDWTALSDIIDDSKRCEEQLQREWVCYE